MKFKTFVLVSLIFIIALAGCKGDTAKKELPKVYMTTEITADSLLQIYKALGREASGKVAIKLHMGEPGNQNFLSANLYRKLVQEVNGTFVDSNVAYGGPRTTTEGSLKAAADHGFTYAPVDILDADGTMILPVKGGKNVREAFFGSRFRDYDFYISVAHFKGHGLSGFGGAFKNLAIGIATPQGKLIVHSGDPDGPLDPPVPKKFLERVAEYGKALMDDLGDRVIYINVLANLSTDCDCDANAPLPTMADIGIVASLDPVAVDKASVDLVFEAAKKYGHNDLANRIKSTKGTHTLKYAEKLGLGSRKYELIKLD